MPHRPASVRALSGRLTRSAVLAGAVSLAAAPAHATWSILIADTRTGEIVLGSATCLTALDLAASTPVVIAGRGAITAQSAVDATGRNRMFARDAILRGDDLSMILSDLSMRDPGHDNRQYGMITADGDALTYSGIDNADWAGGVTGRLERGAPGPADDIVYAVQGNILSGPNVVADTVASIQGAGGSDLPQMLMDAMVAARQAGGDGRCSCSNSAPTSCGEMIMPPFKSAHIGYMIGSRLGDTNHIQAFYDLDAPSTGHASIDLNDDGVPDSVVTLGGTGLLSLHLNPTAPTDQVSRLEFLTTIDTGLGFVEDPVAADLDGDGRDDLLMIDSGSTVAAMIQSAPGVFNAPVTLDLGAPAQGLDAGDLDGDGAGEGVAPIPSTGEVVRIDYGSGALVASVAASTGAQSTRARQGDADGDGDADLLVTLRDTDELWIGLNDGAGAFTELTRLATADQPSDADAGDLDGDTLPDIVVISERGARVQSFMGTGAGFGAPVVTPLGEDGVAVRLASMQDADTTPDLVAITEDELLTATIRRLRTYEGDGAGGFAPISSYRLTGSADTFALRNQNPGCDTDTDAVAPSGARLIVLDNDGAGNLPLNSGFAGGEHYMFINIADQAASDEDPVDQMVTEFDAFRAALVGKTDAVRSVTAPPARILVGQESAARIELRDRAGDPVTGDATFSFKPIGAPVVIGAPTPAGPGVFDIALSDSGGATGRAVVEITVRIGADDPVVLMPRLTVGITDIAADMNGDGAATFPDVGRFLAALAAGDPIADLDKDGVIEPTDDTQAFLDSFMNP